MTTVPLRVYYMAGPGHILGSFRHWQDGHDDPRITAVAYSSQFFDVCRELDADLWAVSSNPEVGRVQAGRITVEHRGDSLAGHAGLAYHTAQIAYAARILRDIRQFRANVAVVFGDVYAWLLEPLRLMGVQVVASMHCVIWPKYGPRSIAQRVIERMSAPFYRSGCSAILSISEDIDAQLRELTGDRAAPIVDFRPFFRRELFESLPPPQPSSRSFRVLFAGRIEPNKGAFDLLEIATRLKNEGNSQIEFDLCGDGSALDELRRRVESLGLQQRFRLHGWTEQQRTRELLGASHAVIVPTRRDFIEGFNKVVVEGVLAGRPVITSTVCPAVAYTRDAVIQVPPDDVGGYYDAVARLAKDAAFYHRLQSATGRLSAQFYDESLSYGSALRRVLGALHEGRKPEPRPLTPPASNASDAAEAPLQGVGHSLGGAREVGS